MSTASPEAQQSFRRFRALRWARRASQAFFLLLFVALLLKTNMDALSSPEELPRISAPVSLFLEMDPLVALGTVLSTHTLYRNLFYALLIIVGTLFLGRFFCGWICPMGTINHMLASAKSGKLRGMARIESNRYRPAQRWKYLILTAVLASAAAGSLQLGLLDPISLLTRSLTLLVFPAWNVLTQDVYTWSLHANGGAFDILLTPLAWLSHAALVRTKVVVFEQTGLILFVFIAILAANRYVTRYWCRILCPLGALLGVLSKTSILGLEKRPSMCSGCNRCALHCQGGDNPEPGTTWHQSECHLCLNCVASCPEAGIAFRFFPKRDESTQAVNMTRRSVLLSTGAGLAAVPLLRTGVHPDTTPHRDLVRPPGSIEEREFLSRCIRCGECMNVCPNNALHPTFLQAGMEGIWSPMLMPRIGYCEPTCVLCSQVCPTGAIDEITEAEKSWVPSAESVDDERRPPLRIGTAFYDFGRCLPWAMAKECIVCEEWCPTTPKAIYFEMAEVTDREGNYHWLKRPHVDPALCVGCGACTFACPVKGAPAIYVTAVGETRNPHNRILLEGAQKQKRSES
ncbi:MAG: 4Fe-4S binding protein [Bacteroidia bacterium]|nr:4Fe-4S binding protein [Bacteroidia bacterium]